MRRALGAVVAVLRLASSAVRFRPAFDYATTGFAEGHLRQK